MSELQRALLFITIIKKDTLGQSIVVILPINVWVDHWFIE